MKKTFNINVGGMPFVIDEDAYNMLSNYLDALDHIFARQEDGKELVDEIEVRISEILSELLVQRGATIVTISDVEAVIARMGNPEAFMEYDETIDTETSSANTHEEATVKMEDILNVHPLPSPMGFLKKRLFRDPQNKMIAGVCSGIAMYFNIDPTWVRLAFIILSLPSFAFFSWASHFIPSIGLVPTIYLILWIVLPEANTPIKQMEMRGEEPTMENVSKSFTQPKASTSPYASRESRRNAVESIVNFIGIIGKAILVVLGIFAWPVAIACVIGVIGCIFAIIMFLSNSGYIWWNELTNANLILDDGVIPGLMCGIFGCVAVCIPCIFLIYQLMYAAKSEKRMSSPMKVTLLVVWILAVIGLAVTIGIGFAGGYM